MIRFGILGCGRHGERYLRHLTRGDVDGATATGLYRRTRREREAMAEQYRVRPHASERALLSAEDVDALVITTPPGVHRGEVERAVEAGLPVLVEKPLCGCWTDARALRDAIGPGPSVMVAQTLRFHPLVRRAREILDRVGAVHRIRLVQRLEPCPLRWQRDPVLAGGGSIVLTGVHLFDLARFFAGRSPDAVICRWLRLGEHPLENCFDALLEFEDEDLLVSCEVSKFSQSRNGRIEIVGERGQIVVDTINGELGIVEGRHARTLEVVGEVPTLPATLSAFVDHLGGRSDNPVDLAEGAEPLRIAEACYRSHDTGRRVRLEEVL